MKFIPHPAVDQAPVSQLIYWKWRLGEWMERTGRRLQYEAEDRCDSCGELRKGRDHTKCDGIPF